MGHVEAWARVLSGLTRSVPIRRNLEVADGQFGLIPYRVQLFCFDQVVIVSKPNARLGLKIEPWLFLLLYSSDSDVSGPMLVVVEPH
jgi:hypothetical protein